MTHAHTIIRPRPARRQTGVAGVTEPAKSPAAAGTGPSGIITARGPKQRGFRLGAIGVTALTLCVLALSAWGVAGTWFALEGRAVAERLVEEQAEMRRAYEDKVRALTRRLVGVASSQMVESGSLEERVADLITRQVEIENRQAVLTSIAEQAGAPVAKLGLVDAPPKAAPEPPARPAALPAGGRNRSVEPIAPAAPEPRAGPPVLRLGAPPASPPPAAPAFAPTPVVPAPLSPTPLSPLGADRATPSIGPRSATDAVPLRERLAGLIDSIQRVEVAQLRDLEGLHRVSQGQVALIRAALSDVGLDAEKLDPPPAAPAAAKRRLGASLMALGPVRKPPEPLRDPFERGIEAAKGTISHVGRLRGVARGLPFDKPMDISESTTSNFGPRSDPFTGGQAMHSGMDFRGETGTPIRASGAGKVTIADWTGGYGNLVEVEHLSGVTTRYAHLSAIQVKAGDAVVPGQVVGLLGSTGRSTGPHLHYETRIDGGAVDPMKFLKAGARVASPFEVASAR